MIALTLVRHAKSDWGDPGVADHDRPLNARGRRDAPALAARRAASGRPVDRVVSSTATRARATAETFGAALGMPVELDRRLYGADPDTILRVVQESGARSILVVAHDPGLTYLAYDLSGGGVTRMPTCAVATFVWDADDWSTALDSAPDAWHFDAPPAR